MECIWYKSNKFHNAPPDKGGIDYVAAPEKQGREPRDDWSFLCFFCCLEMEVENGI